MSKEQLKYLLDQYFDGMTGIKLYHETVKRTATREIEELHELLKYEERNINDVISRYSMYFKLLENEEYKFHGNKRLSVKDSANLVVFHKNRQYQYLLFDAYERFEDAIENAYAYTGLYDKNFWYLKNFGNITLSELEEKQFDWYQEQAKKVKSSEIISSFRRIILEIIEIEKNNSLNIDLKFSLTLIEMLRHIIVHEGGLTNNKKEFIVNIFKRAGMFNNGNLDKKKVAYIESFFGVGEQSSVISLLEVRLDQSGYFYDDRLHGLFDQMMGYVDFLYSTLIQRFDKVDASQN